MNNQEKAIEIARECVYCFADAENGALKMAEWKDQQFKEYLEKKRDSFNKDAEKWFGTKYLEHIGVISKHGWSVINEIINELFPEQEQDNSNNDE